MTDSAFSPDSPAPRIGAWFIGARGSLATTATLGLFALARGPRLRPA